MLYYKCLRTIHIFSCVGEHKGSRWVLKQHIKVCNNKDVKLGGLKTHDYHMLMQEFIPIAICRMLPKNMRMNVIHLCNFYRDICVKRLLKKDVKKKGKGGDYIM